MQVKAESPAGVGQREAESDFPFQVAAKESGFRAVSDLPLAIAMRLLLVGVASLVVFGCAHNPPPPTPPPPPAPTVAKAKATLRPGDWIIRNCQPASDNSCYCHHPAEAIDAGGQQPHGEQQHTVIECR